LAFQNIWVFGIFERGTKRVYVERVEKRDSQTLLSVVRRHVNPSAIIISDCWRGYSLIRQEFTVFSVNHQLNFVSPDNNTIHTNNVERMWRSLKKIKSGELL
jgi:hypothetical protein